MLNFLLGIVGGAVALLAVAVIGFSPMLAFVGALAGIAGWMAYRTITLIAEREQNITRLLLAKRRARLEAAERKLNGGRS